jgi:drug/metabolite transporter (DMT)-like permease
MNAPSQPARWLVFAALAAVYLIWGSTYLAIRFALETMPPFGLAAVRFLIAGGLLYGWMRWRGAPRPQWSEWRSAAIVGVLLLLGGNGMVVWAEQTVPSGIAALMVSSVPLLMVAFDWLLGSRPPRAVIAGLVLGFTGVALLVGPADLGLASSAESAIAVPFHLPGVLALLAASLSWSLGSLYAKRVPWPKKPLVGISMQMLCGGVALALLALVRGEAVDLAAVSARSLGALAYLIVFGALVGFSAYVWLLSAVSTAKATTYAFVNPAVAVVLGWWLAGEPVTTRTLVAAAVIIAGVVLITTARAAGKKSVEPDRGAAEGRAEPACETAV